MMKTLQEIIKEMKADLVRAHQIADVWLNVDNIVSNGYRHEANTLTKHVDRLTLLLNEQPEAITEDAQFRKHDVRRSVASESDQVIGDSGADSSETAAVRQNEQTVKDCHNCKHGKKSLCQYPCWSCHDFKRWEAI